MTGAKIAGMIVATGVRIAGMIGVTGVMTATTAVAALGCCAGSLDGWLDHAGDGRLSLSGTTRAHRAVTR